MKSESNNEIHIQSTGVKPDANFDFSAATLDNLPSKINFDYELAFRFQFSNPLYTFSASGSQLESAVQV